jgi:transposase, IS30 family
MAKHMTLEDRQKICAGLEKAKGFGVIAKDIGKSETSVSREVRNHRIVWNKQPYGRIYNRCVNRNNCDLRNVCSDDCNRKCAACGQCAKSCPMYKEEHCEKLNFPPYVCNACTLVNRCPLEKFRCDPFYAQDEYRTTLRESREGFNLNVNELAYIDTNVTPLILQGHSVNHVAVTLNTALTVSRRTVYRLIDKSALEARNIDLPRKSKLKPRKGTKAQKKIDKKCREGRTMEDFKAYMQQHPEINPSQMDTVKGGAGSSKVLLTFHLRGDFMPVFLRDANTALSVQEWIDFLYDGLGHDDFCAFFPVILTDNGSEFSNPEALEKAPDGTPRTKIFYCDPMASWQKPNVERCRRRAILS